MKRQILTIAVLLAAAFSLGLTLGHSNADEKAEDTTVYELHEGKLPDLHKRFRDHTMKIFARVGMKNVIYWTPEDNENTLVYVLAHKSRKAADESWAAFRDDPEWKAAFAESRKDGPLVMKVEKQFLTATDYSPMK
jgi:hypothetical protein